MRFSFFSCSFFFACMDKSLTGVSLQVFYPPLVQSGVLFRLPKVFFFHGIFTRALDFLFPPVQGFEVRGPAKFQVFFECPSFFSFAWKTGFFPPGKEPFLIIFFLPIIGPDECPSFGLTLRSFCAPPSPFSLICHFWFFMKHEG